MRRREFVKSIIAVPVTAPYLFGEQAAPPRTGTTTPVPLKSADASADVRRPQMLEPETLQITSSVPDQVAVTEWHYFSERQFATLQKLCAVMMPPLNGNPGAIEAGAPEFLDFLIGVSPEERQQMYRSGLDRLHAEAESRFGIAFAEVNAGQAASLLRPWLRAWITDHPPEEPWERFINVAHHDIRTATMNSRIWSLAAISGGARAPAVGMYWSPIDPDIQR